MMRACCVCGASIEGFPARSTTCGRSACVRANRSPGRRARRFVPDKGDAMKPDYATRNRVTRAYFAAGGEGWEPLITTAKATGLTVAEVISVLKACK